jgi:hypothetical protein
MSVQILRPSNFRSVTKSRRAAEELKKDEEQRRTFLHDYARRLVLEHRKRIIFQHIESELVERSCADAVAKSDTECGSACKVLSWPKKDMPGLESSRDDQLVIDLENAVVETLLSTFAGYLKSLAVEVEA